MVNISDKKFIEKNKYTVDSLIRIIFRADENNSQLPAPSALS